MKGAGIRRQLWPERRGRVGRREHPRMRRERDEGPRGGDKKAIVACSPLKGQSTRRTCASASAARCARARRCALRYAAHGTQERT
eukprot:4498060-Pleurochrysis_carterae.AAC.1